MRLMPATMWSKPYSDNSKDIRTAFIFLTISVIANFGKFWANFLSAYVPNGAGFRLMELESP